MGLLRLGLLLLMAGQFDALSLYYKLDPGDLLNATIWPSQFLKYDVFVADPGFSAQQLATVRTAVPGAKVLAYSCMGWSYLDAGCAQCHGARCDTGYMKPEYLLTDLTHGGPVCPFGGWGHPVVSAAVWVPFKESCEAMANYHMDVTLKPGYDGLYIDDFFDEIYIKWVEYANLQSGWHLAGDGTGTNTSIDALQSQWAAWKPYYTAFLRKGLGPNAILIANVRTPSVSDPSLNGVTIEFEHCAGDESPHQPRRAHAAGADARNSASFKGGRGPVDSPVVTGGSGAAGSTASEQHHLSGDNRSSGGGSSNSSALAAACRELLVGQHAVSGVHGLPPVFGLWLTHSEVVPAATQCRQMAAIQRELGWVGVGEDITDCTRETGPASCVRC